MSYTDDYAFELGSCENDRNQRLMWLSMHRRAEAPRALALLPPGYERRIHHYSVFARALADNGYLVVRFDLSNHVGLSDGHIADFSMTSLEGDIRSMLGSQNVTESNLPTVVIAPSLSARASARALTRAGSSVAGCVMLLPVADVEYTIAQAAGIDGIGMWRRGDVTDPDLLYHVVEHDVKFAFAQDAVDRDWGGAEQARQDIRQIRGPVVAISAEHDDWVRVQNVEHAMSGETESPRRLTVLEATSHDVAHNPPVMRLLMTTTVQAAAEMIGQDAGAVAIPDFQEIVQTVTTERRWARDEYAHVAVDAVTTSASYERTS